MVKIPSLAGYPLVGALHECLSFRRSWYVITHRYRWRGSFRTSTTTHFFSSLPFTSSLLHFSPLSITLRLSISRRSHLESPTPPSAVGARSVTRHRPQSSTSGPLPTPTPFQSSDQFGRTCQWLVTLGRCSNVLRLQIATNPLSCPKSPRLFVSVNSYPPITLSI